MDVTSALTGLSFSLSTLYDQISAVGWSVKRVKFDTGRDCYVASAKDQRGNEAEAFGPTERLALSHLLIRVQRTHHMRNYSKVSMWTSSFVDQLQDIAEAYSKAPLYEPKAAAAFMELAHDCERRMEALGQHLEIAVVNNPEPYKSADAMFDDIRKRRKLEVSRAGIDHPIWSEGQVIAYRVVHDVLGHAASGGGFDWPGENLAFSAHAAVLSAESQKALFAESIGAAAYAAFYRAYGPQKVALFPTFMDRVQERENPHKLYPGIHPSQSYPPVPMPGMKPLVASWGHDYGMERTAADPSLSDPNEGWSSGVEPQNPNGFLDHGDPLGSGLVADNAKKIDTEWAYLNQNDPGELATMKLAIENAFRAVLLSPLKNLQHNTMHYQDLMKVPAGTTDPSTYWDTLENARQHHNVARFGEESRFAHMPHYAQIPALENILYQRNPHAGPQAAKLEAKHLLFQWQQQEQEKVIAEDERKPEDKRMNTYQIELLANKRLVDRLKTYIKEFQPELDHRASMPALQETMFDSPTVSPAPKPMKYPAFIGTHLQAIAQVSQHVDDILKAALEDVHEHDGAGHHFRAAVMQMGVRGVGPKVCSFAWLLLQPMTSQLATIDTHMMRVLGHNYDKEMNNRDYFKFERELATGRDAAGYGHMPLGQFQWSQWDNARTGPGTHSDHSGLRVLDPKPHTNIDWDAKPPMNERAVAPDWWINTQGERDQTADDFDQRVAPNFGKNQIPFQNAVYTARTAASSRVPWFMHAGERVQGIPGQTLMGHLTQSLGLDPTQVWAQYDEPLVGKL